MGLPRGFPSDRPGKPTLVLNSKPVVLGSYRAQTDGNATWVIRDRVRFVARAVKVGTEPLRDARGHIRQVPCYRLEFPDLAYRVYVVGSVPAVLQWILAGATGGRPHRTREKAKVLPSFQRTAPKTDEDDNGI